MTPRQIIEDIYNLVKKCEETDYNACYEAINDVNSMGCKAVFGGFEPLHEYIFEHGLAYASFSAIASYAYIAEHVKFDASRYESRLRFLASRFLRHVKLEEAYDRWRSDFMAFFTNHLRRGR